MADKYARRRRALLGVLVLAVLVVLTTIFGAAENSPLHPVQQGIARVVKPIGDGASKVFSPVNDLSGWVSSTLHAKSENGRLRTVNARLDTELGQAGVARADTAQLTALQGLTSRLDLSQDAPAYANVVQYDPELYYESIGIDEGAQDGIRVGDPVVGDSGLIGKITATTATTATVAAISSPKMGVEVQIQDPSGHGASGTVEPEVGDPHSLEVEYLPSHVLVNSGDRVVTATYSDPDNRLITSPYPAGIPVGVITTVSSSQLENDNSVAMSSDVDLENVSEVEVLTHVRS